MAKRKRNKNKEGDGNWKDPSKRDNKTAAIIGDKGQGKSTLIVKLAKMYYQNSVKSGIPKRVLIYDPSEARGFKIFKKITLPELKHGVYNPHTGGYSYWTQGIRRIEDDGSYDYEDFFTVIRTRVTDSLIFIDEAADIFPSKSELKRYQKELITKHRNFNIDLYLVFHNFMDIHVRLRGKVWLYILFRTIEKPDGPNWFGVRQFPNPSQFYEVWKQGEEVDHDPAKIQQNYVLFKKSFTSRLD